MNAIIVCGGLSTRLGDITKSTPKILLEIKGKSVLEWQLEKLKAVGARAVVLAAGHLAEVLHKRVGLNFAGVDIQFAIEDERLGTGGAIKHAWQYLENQAEPVIVLNGDILTGVNLADMMGFVRPLSDGSILGVEVPDASSYGTLEFDEKYHLKIFKEKAGKHERGFINGGIYIFNAAARQYFPAEKSFSLEYDIFPKMRELYVYTSSHPWVDIGVPERLEWARQHWVS